MEREVELIPLPGSVMVPDFRLVHPDGKTYVLEIVGYWRPEYLKKKFSQVARSGRDDIILLVSERLNLKGAGVKIHETPAKVVWFEGKANLKDVLGVLGANYTVIDIWTACSVALPNLHTSFFLGLFSRSHLLVKLQGNRARGRGEFWGSRVWDILSNK